MRDLDFKRLFESAPNLYLVLTPDQRIAAASDAYLKATMTRREDILGRGVFEVFPDNPDDPGATGMSNLRNSLERVLRSGAPDTMAVQKYDVRLPEAQGGGFEVRYWSPVNTPVLGAEGRVDYIIHRVEDVTEFVRLKREGSEQNRLADDLRARAGKMEQEVFLRAQEVQEANRRLEKAHDELEGRVRERTEDLVRSNERLRQEIQEKAQLQSQLLQSQKMEAVGRLAGGVAHDFNNLLTAIGGYGHFLRDSLPAGDKRREDVEEIMKAAERAAGLTRQLLAFSRQQVLQMKVLDCNALVAELEKMLRRIIGEDVELVAELSKETGRIKADPGQIEQVLLNLVVNAKDAMPGGGRITIGTTNVELGEEYARMHLQVKQGSYVMFSVADTGCGMDESTLSRIFEPFFTTKEQGKGTGLGLATVYGIVKQSGGGIYVYSEPGQGTVFKIYFPRVDEAAQPVAAPAAPRGAAAGTETVLVVEDDEMVRKFVQRALAEAGYQVLAARDPAAAVELCERHASPIHLILSDVVMPQMHGPELMKKLTLLRPQARVIFMSGYTDTAVAHRDLVASGVPFLQKPLAPGVLTRKVREVLDAAGC